MREEESTQRACYRTTERDCQKDCKRDGKREGKREETYLARECDEAEGDTDGHPDGKGDHIRVVPERVTLKFSVDVSVLSV
jgi:hypothetical protein